ncbi:alpha/beta hydrolase [Brevundimonas sp.]|uniref:alpha/beta fold hydrolase n=1 Tax=Brevundimonas sp. TaxID=1871086 RepID=UPI002631D1BD|nr:alpha/beta hydrolase [Brevundimonas sp.]
MTAPAFRHHRVVRDGVGLHAVSLGEGPAVLLIHGFPQHWWMWRKTMADLAAGGFRAVAIDQRGMGGSDIPPAGYGKADLARDAFAVLDALEVPRASVVGYDHGGGTALAMALSEPARVARLAVLEYAPPGFGYEAGLTAAPDNVNWQLAFFTYPDVAVSFIAGRERQLLSWYFQHWSHNPDAVPQDDFEVYVRALQRPGALRGGFMQFASVFEDMAWFKARAVEGRLSLPCLGVGGAGAAGGWPEMALRALADDVQGAVIPDAGHWLAEEQALALSETLLEFLRPERG